MDDVGDRLRKVREMHGLSQRQLAKKSGISNATISIVEHGKTNISLGVLKQLLEAVPMTVSDFFTLDLSSTDQIFFNNDELSEISSGNVSYKQIGTNLEDSKIQMLIETYPPGADTGRSKLIHESEETGIIIEGFIEATVGDQTRILRTGDAYKFDSRIPHRFRNTGKKDCVLISACSPPSF